MRLFIGRARHYDDDGKPERRYFYVALHDDPDSNAPCEASIGSLSLARLTDTVIHLGKAHGRPRFELASIVDCPGHSGFEPRLYEALTYDEIVHV